MIFKCQDHLFRKLIKKILYFWVPIHFIKTSGENHIKQTLNIWYQFIYISDLKNSPWEHYVTSTPCEEIPSVNQESSFLRTEQFSNNVG